MNTTLLIYRRAMSVCSLTAIEFLAAGGFTPMPHQDPRNYMIDMGLLFALVGAGVMVLVRMGAF